MVNAEEQLQQAKIEISKSLQMKMIERNITQKELADMLRVSKQTVNLAVNGGNADYLVRLRKRIRKILGD